LAALEAGETKVLDLKLDLALAEKVGGRAGQTERCGELQSGMIPSTGQELVKQCRLLFSNPVSKPLRIVFCGKGSVLIIPVTVST
jgi:hypothetical protein